MTTHSDELPYRSCSKTTCHDVLQGFLHGDDACHDAPYTSSCSVAHPSCQLGDVLVLGLGLTGEAVARYCATVAASRVRSVTVYGGLKAQESSVTAELRALGCEIILGTEQVEGHYDLCISSPGISEFSDFFVHAAAASREAISEPEFAWRESPERWLAITGTNGKTTTTTLLRDLLRAGGLEAQEVGNIGTLATSQIRDRTSTCWFVAELSSFQLARSFLLHPRVAILLNITPDHFSWHRSAQNYAAAKERVFANLDAGDLAILFDGDATCREIARRLDARGVRVCHLSVEGAPDAPERAWVSGEMLYCELAGTCYELLSTEELPIKGQHNQTNALAAAACALELGIDISDVRRGLREFRALEHRIEPVATIDGIAYVNDSKATNVDATIKALTAFQPGRTIVLLGGHDKMTPLDELARAVCTSCRGAVCFGDAGGRLAAALAAFAGASGSSEPPATGEISEPPTAHTAFELHRVDHLVDALECARGIARQGDVVLLSPACSSFDEFSGFEERGRIFKQLVESLKILPSEAN